MADELTHLDAHGAARMVGIEDKAPTHRHAVARARVVMEASTLERIVSGTAAKGDVLASARIAGIMAAKRTAELIPLCHPVATTRAEVALDPDPQLPGILVTARVHAVERTGPEMEAMVAASIAALTIYDMCKAVDRAMRVEQVELLEKSGGKSGHWVRAEPSGS